MIFRPFKSWNYTTQRTTCHYVLIVTRNDTICCLCLSVTHQRARDKDNIKLEVAAQKIPSKKVVP